MVKKEISPIIEILAESEELLEFINDVRKEYEKAAKEVNEKLYKLTNTTLSWKSRVKYSKPSRFSIFNPGTIDIEISQQHTEDSESKEYHYFTTRVEKGQGVEFRGMPVVVVESVNHKPPIRFVGKSIHDALDGLVKWVSNAIAFFKAEDRKRVQKLKQMRG